MMPQEIRSTIEDFLKTAGFHVADIEERFDPITESTVFNILSQDARLLIGRDGDTVKAMNHLIHKMIDQKIHTQEKKEEFPTFSLDVDDYYKKRFELLKSKVTLLANRVRSFTVDQALEPMNGYERLMVHHIVGALPDISSESEGTGRERHVVLKYTPSSLD
ncbi:hypothetical protein H6776_00625 [Candidatus Nomurabacteria bacterium]|nr:hypothetical protein [Candidatus Nomurabacteria bacterium]